jgi:hypothetical protein
MRAEIYIPSLTKNIVMFAEYIKAAMDKAVYEIIDDPEPFFMARSRSFRALVPQERRWKPAEMTS